MVLPSLLNSSSIAMTSPPRSRESAFRSSTKEVGGFTSFSSPPNCPPMILRTRSKTVAKLSPPCARRCDGTENSVDELRRSLAAELLGQLDGFIDGCAHRHPISDDDLVDGKPEDAAVHRRHLLQRPGRRVLADDLVQSLAVPQEAAHEVACELGGGLGQGGILQLTVQGLVRRGGGPGPPRPP